MLLNPVGWFEIYVEDIDRAQRFYESVRQCSLSSLPLPDEGNDEFQMRAFPRLTNAS
ncbi:MAG: hypothetical protein ABJZ55_05240 [Fuerstiella sp.]